MYKKKERTKANVIGPLVDFKKNASAIIRISPMQYEETDYIDIREWYATNDGKHLPTKKGFTIHPSMLTLLIKALQKSHQVMSFKEAEEENS